MALDVVGKVARVTADIAPGHLGEVLIEVRQGTERFLARASNSSVTIRKRAQVIVVGSLGGRTVEVEPDRQPEASEISDIALLVVVGIVRRRPDRADPAVPVQLEDR